MQAGILAYSPELYRASDPQSPVIRSHLDKTAEEHTSMRHNAIESAILSDNAYTAGMWLINYSKIIMLFGEYLQTKLWHNKHSAGGREWGGG